MIIAKAAAGAALLSLALALPAAAEVKTATPQGFEDVQSVTVHASPHDTYAALLAVGNWWNGAHSFSGEAANIVIEPKVGGCWCEHLKEGGEVQHMAVSWLLPDKRIEFRGALGPLRFEGVAGTYTWALKAVEGGTEVTQNYVIGGYFREGGEHWAPIVDNVMQEQLTRFARFVDTGSPGGK